VRIPADILNDVYAIILDKNFPSELNPLPVKAGSLRYTDEYETVYIAEDGEGIGVTIESWMIMGAIFTVSDGNEPNTD